MKKINNVLVLFIFINLGVLLGVWFFIQSEFFGNIISKQANRLFINNDQIQFQFKNITIGLFPPSTSLHKVKFTYKKSNEMVDLIFNQVDAEFRYTDFFRNDLFIGHLYATNGSIDLVGLNSKEKTTDKINLHELYSVLDSLLNTYLPFKLHQVTLDKIRLDIDNNKAIIDNLNFRNMKSKRKYIFSGEVKELKLRESTDFSKKLEHGWLRFSFELLDGSIQFSQANFYKEFLELNLIGSVANDKMKNLLTDLSINVKIPSTELVRLIKYDDILDEVEGDLDLNIQLRGNIKKPLISFSAEGYKVKTKFAFGDEVNLKGEIKNDIVYINSLLLKENLGNIKLVAATPVFNLNSKEFTKAVHEFEIYKIHSNTALYVISDTLDILKTQFSGKLNVHWDGEQTIFTPKPGFYLDDLKLQNEKDDTPIIINKRLAINQGEIRLKSNLDVEVDVGATFDKSKLNITGSIQKDRLDLDIKDSFVNMNSLGPILGVQMKGDGPIDITIKGNYEKGIKFTFLPQFSNFSLFDLTLEMARAHLIFDIKNNVLEINKLFGTSDDLKYNASGFVDFKKDNLKLDFNFHEITYQKSLKTFKGILPITKYWFPEKIRSRMSMKVALTGGISVKNLIAKGQIHAANINSYGEGIDKVNIEFEFIKHVLNLKKISMKKGEGILNGSFLVDIENDYFEYLVKLEHLKTDSIDIYRILNLGLEGEYMGGGSGNGQFDNYSAEFNLRLYNTKVDTVPVEDSNLSLYSTNNDYYFSGNFLGENISFNSFININSKAKEKSYFNIHSEVDDIKILLGIFSAHNTRDDELSGNIYFNLSSQFSMFDFGGLDLDFNLQKFNLKTKMANLTLDDNTGVIDIKNGDVIQLALKVSDKKQKINIIGEGNLKSGINVEHDIIVNAEALQILTPIIKKSSGIMSLKGSSYISLNRLAGNSEIYGENISMKLEGIPAIFENIDIQLRVNQDRLIIDQLKGEFGKGRLDASGDMLFKLPFPELNFDLNLTEAIIPLMEKSQIVVSGHSSITGKSLPYSVDGQISILKGYIVDSIAEISKKYQTDDSYKKYIPIKKYERRVDFFSYNYLLNIVNPLHLKNRIADIKLIGSTKLNMKAGQLGYLGQFSAKPFISKFVFKGNDFKLQEGIIDIDSNKKPEVNIAFHGVTSINDYEVKLNVDGPSDNINIGFSAEPFLEQEDILSLLTLGVTSDISKKLKERERQSVTTIGLGSLIMDQLRVNEGLNSSLGLKLSVLPEFSENEDTLLEGKSGVTNSTSSRVKSATKIKLQKKISRKVDVAVSSTVGGSIDEKQEMKINYNINKAFSLEGVYELKSDDGEQSNKPESVGADLKYKWSF